MKIIILILLLMAMTTPGYAYTRDARLDKNSVGIAYGESIADPEIHPTQKTLISRAAFEKILSNEWSFGFLYKKNTEYGMRAKVFFGSIYDEGYQFFEWSFNKSITKSDDYSACWIFGIYQAMNSSDGNMLSNWAFMPEVGVAVSRRIYGPLLLRSNLVLSGILSLGLFVELPYGVDAGMEYSYNSAVNTGFPEIASLSFKF